MADYRLTVAAPVQPNKMNVGEQGPYMATTHGETLPIVSIAQATSHKEAPGA
jgi:hypothetical protein